MIGLMMACVHAPSAMTAAPTECPLPPQTALGCSGGDCLGLSQDVVPGSVCLGEPGWGFTACRPVDALVLFFEEGRCTEVHWFEELPRACLPPGGQADEDRTSWPERGLQARILDPESPVYEELIWSVP